MVKKDLTIFVAKNRALGDSLLGLSTIAYFRSLYPKSTIIYAIPQWTTHLYSKVKTEADIIYPLKLNSTNDVLDLYTDLINMKVDVIHEMHQSGRGKKVFTLFSLLKNIPYTFHNHHLNSGTKVIDQGVKKELIQRDLDGVYSYFGKSKSYPSYLDFEPCLKFDRKRNPLERIILGVVATRNTKKWPLDNYISLAEKLIEIRPDVEFVIPLSKSKDDLEIKSHLEKLIKTSKIKIIQEPLDQLPELFYDSKMYVGNDTGLKHLAVSVGIPTITLFGPEPIREWHPYSIKKHVAFYIEDLKCRTREHHYCGLMNCDLEEGQNMQCMKLITVDNILKTTIDLCQKY